MKRNLFSILASWWLFAALVLSLCAASLAFTFNGDPSTRLIHFLFHSRTGAALYLGICVNLLFVNIRIISARLRKKEIRLETIKAMDAWMEAPAMDADVLESVARRVKRFGPVRRRTPDTVQIERGIFSFIPGAIFRTAVVLLLLALFASVHLRKTGEITLRAGETGTLLDANITVNAIDAGMPEDFLSVGDNASFLLDHVSATLRLSETVSQITPGFPVKINGRYYRIVHLGYAQPLTVNGTAQPASLDLLPPGRTHIVALPSHFGLMTVSLAPERIIDKGLLKGKQYNLARPLYSLVFQPEGKQAAADKAVIKPGDKFIRGPLSLSFGLNFLFVKIQVVEDPALPFIYAGLVMSLAGAALMFSRFFWYHTELTALRMGNRMYIGASEEFFKKWGIEKFYRMREAFLSEEQRVQGE